jgi:hypothetical protein
MAAAQAAAAAGAAAALSEVGKRLVAKRASPPAFFGAGRADRSDVAERAEELLDEGSDLSRRGRRPAGSRG